MKIKIEIVDYSVSQKKQPYAIEMRTETAPFGNWIISGWRYKWEMRVDGY